VLFCALCCLIPVIGPILMLGYLFEIIDSLLRSPAKPYPDFDFNRFGDYLLRGVWPFLVELIVSFVLVPVLLIPFVAALIGFLASASGGNGSAVVVVIAVPILIIL